MKGTLELSLNLKLCNCVLVHNILSILAVSGWLGSTASRFICRCLHVYTSVCNVMVMELGHINRLKNSVDSCWLVLSL